MCKFLSSDDKNIVYIHLICETRLSFLKLVVFKRKEHVPPLHCSDDCLKKSKNYVTHKVKCLQYERVAGI